MGSPGVGWSSLAGSTGGTLLALSTGVVLVILLPLDVFWGVVLFCTGVEILDGGGGESVDALGVVSTIGVDVLVILGVVLLVMLVVLGGGSSLLES